MNPEKQTSRPELSRKQKLVRRFLPLAFVAAGGSVGYGAAEASSPEHRSEAVAEASTSVHTSKTVELGNAETGWGYGAAERAIQSALIDGLNHIDVLTPETPEEPVDIGAVVADLPVYEQANEALEMAGYDQALADSKDTLTVELDVKLTDDHTVTYEVTGATITDTPNTQS
jgi:hypothetical protein